eukprot:TRINITY_DN25354_c0_g1_i1.p1 TRINITY_DN25354_c0_g1~~TRINITY_DN25354_c0_g1_i1.p1  ORF type:complete len:494 (+),score=148.73 TRINITY_DN25354_c0_g1_i1:67-1548(+)
MVEQRGRREDSRLLDVEKGKRDNPSLVLPGNCSFNAAARTRSSTGAKLKKDDDDSGPLPQKAGCTAHFESDVTNFRVFCMTMFNFPYGCICTTMGMFVLPSEANRLFPEQESVALGFFLLLVGLSQLVCPYVGLVSDRSTFSIGRRRPFILFGTALALCFVQGMQTSSRLMMPYAFGASLFFGMLALNVIYSAQCGLVPDMVPESRQGAASGMVAVQQLMGSFLGFTLVMLSTGLDIHLAYFFYQALLSSVVLVVCVASRETPLDTVPPRPSWREIYRSYTIDTTKDRDFFWVFVSRTFFYMAVSCQAFMLYYLRDVMGSKSEAKAREEMSIIALIGQFTAATVAYPMGYVTDSYGISRKVLIYVACCTMALVYVLFIVCPLVVPQDYALHTIFSVAAIYGLGNGCYLAVDYALALDVLPNKATSAQDLGVWGIAAFLGSSVGPMLWGGLLAAAGREESSESYTFTGYVLMLSGGVAACFGAGISVRFVKGST